MARTKLEQVIKTWIFTPETPPNDSTALNATIRVIIDRLLGDLARLKGGGQGLKDAPATDLTTLNTHQTTTDGSDHGGHIIQVQDHGSNLARTFRKINLAGSGNTVSTTGDTVTVSTSSGGAGGTDHTVLSAFHTDTNAGDTPSNGDVLRRTGEVWEAGPVDSTNVASSIVDPVAGTAGLRTLGTGAQQAAAGADLRFHTRGHSLLSDTDHTDMTSGLTPNDGQTLQYQASTSKWVLAPPPYVATTFIDGLVLNWVSGTQLGIDSGACYIPGAGKVLELSAGTSYTISSFAASSAAWHYIYAYDNGSGGLAFDQPSTVEPVVYRGWAKHKTGDTSRRYIGAVLPDGATTPSMRKWQRNQQGFVRWLEHTGAGSVFLVGNDKRETVETNIDCSTVVPVTSRTAYINLDSSATAAYLYFGHSEDNITLSTTSFLHYVAPGNKQVPASIVLDSLRRFSFRWNTAPAVSTGFFPQVLGYWETR